MRNPDPKGYMMAAAEKRALNEAEGNQSVASLLSEEPKDGEDIKKDEEA
jgi:hypothetical protein